VRGRTGQLLVNLNPRSEEANGGLDLPPYLGNSVMGCPGTPECSDNGECTNGSCVCSFGWYRKDCSVNVAEVCAL